VLSQLVASQSFPYLRYCDSINRLNEFLFQLVDWGFHTLHIFRNNLARRPIRVPEVRNVVAHLRAVHHALEFRLALKLEYLTGCQQYAEFAVTLRLCLARKHQAIGFGALRVVFIPPHGFGP